MRRLHQARILGAIAAASAAAACGEFDPSFGYLNVGGQASADAGAGGVRFGRDIRPIIARTIDDPEPYGCKTCHYSTEPVHVGLDLGGLDVSTLGALRMGGATTGTRIIVAGDPDASGIVQKLRGTYPFGARMPRQGEYWGDDEMALITSWIEDGAEGADDE